MPPKADSPVSASKVGRPKGTKKGINLSSEDFKIMLLEALRLDDEVRTAVSMIVTSRETDVFSAVVKCLESGHEKINEQIGTKLFL